MRLLCALFAMLLMASIQAQAQGRPDARTMTCGEVRSLIDQRGAVVITTGNYTYQRFVAHRGFCNYSERIGHDWIATSDIAECRLRICVDPLKFKRRGRR